MIEAGKIFTQTMSLLVLGLFSMSSTFASATFGRNCCSVLSASLGSKVSYPNSTFYVSSLTSYWSQQEEQIHPQCIVSPTTSQDVSTAVKILSIPIRGETCKFAVRSGGHTAFAGSANIENGVTIDLRALNEITLSRDRYLVTLGTGQRWGNVYAVLEKYRIAAAGGRAGGVGIGGSTLGGGLSYFAPQQGFACDHVVSYEIVLAGGKIINATANSSPDLWLALKGGSNIFGIVTKFTTRTFKQGLFWGGSIYTPAASTRKQQLEAFSNIISAPNYDTNAGLLMTFAFNINPASPTPTPFSYIIATQLIYAKPVVNASIFKNFTSISPQLFNTMAITNLSSLSRVDQEQSPPHLQELTWSTSFNNDHAMLNAVIDIWNSSTLEVANISGIAWSLTIQPLNSAINSRSVALGGNSLGLPTHPRGGSIVLLILSATWNNESDNSFVQRVADTFLASIVSGSKHSGTFNRFIDLNHADRKQDPISGYGPTSKARMQAVSKKYDPLGVFQKQLPRGFKLF